MIATIDQPKQPIPAWKICAECGSEQGERYFDAKDKKWKCRNCFYPKGHYNYFNDDKEY